MDYEENYEEKYKEALEKARIWKEKSGMTKDKQGILDNIFPELKECKDERIRKAILSGLKYLETELGWDAVGDVDILDVYAWLGKQETSYTKRDVENAYIEGVAFAKNELEKQGEQKHKFIIGDIISNNNVIYRVDNIVKNCIGQDCYFLVNIESEKRGTRYLIMRDSEGKTSHMGEITWLCDQVDAKFEKQSEKLTNKIEPKFHEGEWIVWKNKCYKVNDNDCGYELIDQNSLSTSLEYGTIDENAHIFGIADAKDGDVLVDMHGNIGIFQECGDIFWYSYIYLGCDGKLRGFSIGGAHEQTDTHPATKEQSDNLMKAMTDAGYKFDFEKKELKNIEKDLTEFESNMIQWKGNNLNEVIAFTGKDKNFDKWFKSFEEYEEYVHEHNDIFKLFNEDGSHYEVPVGAWIVKTPDGRNVASKAIFKNKPADWSVDDRTKVQRICGYLNEIKKYYADINEVRECIDWLKSIKERIGWKPSEEQMEALTLAIHDVHEMWYKKHLLSLKQQLKQI